MGLGLLHLALLEDPHGARLDGLLRGAGARLLDLLLVARQLRVELLDLLVHRVAPLVYLRPTQPAMAGSDEKSRGGGG